MTFLDKLKKISPCPVDEITMVLSAGMYFHPTNNSIDLDGRICINKQMNIFEKEGTLVHEIGHARCFNRSCKCHTKQDHVLTEVHAELFALHYLLRRGNKKAIEARFKRLHQDWDYENYYEAKAIIKKRRIYKRCQEFVKTYDLLFNV